MSQPNDWQRPQDQQPRQGWSAPPPDVGYRPAAQGMPLQPPALTPQPWQPQPVQQSWQPPPTPMPFGYGPQLTRPYNGIANAGGTVGIVGAVLSLIPILGIVIGIPMGIVAIVLSSIGQSRAARLAGAGKGMATTGLVLGILTVVFKCIPG